MSLSYNKKISLTKKEIKKSAVILKKINYYINQKKISKYELKLTGQRLKGKSIFSISDKKSFTQYHNECIFILDSLYSFEKNNVVFDLNQFDYEKLYIFKTYLEKRQSFLKEKVKHFQRQLNRLQRPCK